MSFLNTAFLWGLPLLAVPVAIHLLSRRRQEIVKWGAMQFLLESSIRRRKIWRLDDLILMLLRTLAVIALVLALARPLWHGSNFAGGAGRDVIFVWDVSLSMDRRIEDHPSFDRMLEKTQELFGSLGATDSLRGLVTIGRGEWLATEPLPATEQSQQRLLDALRKTGVTEASSDWFTVLSSALRVNAPADKRGRIVVVLSDGQASGWREQDSAGWQNLVLLAESAELPTRIEIHNVAGQLPPVHNLAVDKLSTPRTLLGRGESFTVEAELRNHGYTPVHSATIEWFLGDESQGKASAGPLGVGQSIKIPFKSTAGKPGIHRLTCRLEFPDDLEADNACTLILETIDRVPLLLVDDSAETDPLKTDRGYVLAALGQDKSGTLTPDASGLFQVITLSTAEFQTRNLSEFRAVIFPNVPSLEEAAISKLTEFVRQGGGLWLGLGDRTAVDDFNAQFYRFGSGLSPWPIAPPQGDADKRTEFLTIHPPVKEHPATVLLSDTQRLDIDRAKVFRHFPFAPAPARAQVPVLLQSGTGEPLAIEGFLGRGRILVQTLPMGIRWSNLPLMQAYVPLVHEWLWYSIQPTGVTLNLIPGETLQVPLPPNEHLKQVELKRPGGAVSSLSRFEQGDRSLAQSRQTQRPGQYEAAIQMEGKPDEIRPYQVARSPEESNLNQWPETLTAKWNALPLLKLNPSAPLELPTGVSGRQLGDPLWETLLAIVVLALLVELGMIGRMASKRFAFRADSPSSSPAGWRRIASLIGLGGNG